MKRKPLVFVPSEELPKKYFPIAEPLFESSEYRLNINSNNSYFNGTNSIVANPTRVEYTHPISGKRYAGYALNGDLDFIHQVRCTLQKLAEQEWQNRVSSNISLGGNISYNNMNNISWYDHQTSIHNYNRGWNNTNYNIGLSGMIYGSSSINVTPSIGTDVDITIKGWFKTKIQKVFSLHLERKFKSLVLADIPSIEFKGLKRLELKLSKYE